MRIKHIIHALVLSSFITARATIVTSATFTHISPNDLIDMDATLAPGYGVPSDWQIYKKDIGNNEAKVYTQKLGKDDLVILHNSLSDIDAPLTFRYTWFLGDPVASGTNVHDLGFGGWGSFIFDRKHMDVGDAGLIRLYISTGSKAETFSFTSHGNISEGSIDIGANEQGSIDIVYTNSTAINGNYLRITTSADLDSKLGVYAFATAGVASEVVPEPVVMGFIGIVGMFVLVVGRIFRRA